MHPSASWCAAWSNKMMSSSFFLFSSFFLHFLSYTVTHCHLLLNPLYLVAIFLSALFYLPRDMIKIVLHSYCLFLLNHLSILEMIIFFFKDLCWIWFGVSSLCLYMGTVFSRRTLLVHYWIGCWHWYFSISVACVLSLHVFSWRGGGAVC